MPRGAPRHGGWRSARLVTIMVILPSGASFKDSEPIGKILVARPRARLRRRASGTASASSQPINFQVLGHLHVAVQAIGELPDPAVELRERRSGRTRRSITGERRPWALLRSGPRFQCCHTLFQSLILPRDKI